MSVIYVASAIVIMELQALRSRRSKSQFDGSFSLYKVFCRPNILSFLHSCKTVTQWGNSTPSGNVSLWQEVRNISARKEIYI